MTSRLSNATSVRQDARDLWEELFSVFGRTENALKASELNDDGISAPISTQFRYAACHLIRFMRDEEIDQLKEAVAHVKRAYFDAREITLMCLLDDIEEIRCRVDGFSFILKDHIDGYQEKKKAVLDAVKFIERPHSGYQSNRDAFYQSCDPHIDALRDFVDSYVSAEDEINDTIAREKKVWFWKILGACVGIVSLIFGLLKWYFP